MMRLTHPRKRFMTPSLLVILYFKPKSVKCIVIGAGPSGATAAYFLGKQGRRVALIDKKKFPRHKPCGDAWCKPALDILEEMGVLKKMEADNIARPVKRGGLISPFGYKCINTDGSNYGSVTGCKTYAIKRYIADEYLVRAAAALPSVHLFEETEVSDVEYEPSTSPDYPGCYKASTKSLAHPTLTGTMCLICDGSTSYLAQKLGVIPKSQPEAVSSHAYVKAGTHNWKEADGVMIFNKSTLPGYSALFRHYNDDMYLGECEKEKNPLNLFF
jgi:menaquinone-9 beta-reductase